jgi:small-conductance mechanosensitive channel
MVIFEGYGDSSLNFTLYLWVYFNVGMSTKSDVALQIYDALKEAGLDMPIPQQKVFYTTEKSNKSQKFPPVG